MGSQFLKLVALTLAALCSWVRAQNQIPFNFTTNWNPAGEGCVDPAGFVSCYGFESTSASSCKAVCASDNTKGSSSYNLCNDACERLQLAGNVGCWIQSCWNQVYSCGYQLAALSYFDGSGLAQSSAVPFYPPPDDATGGACSCNLGYVYGNISTASTFSGGSSCEVIAGSDNATFYQCSCCDLSWPISNILNICPHSDLSVMGFGVILSDVVKELAPSTNKCSILDNGTETCISDYNFPFAGSTAYNPLALPTGIPGTQALSNSPGNAFTVFPSAVVPLTLLSSYTSTITPAPFAAAASADPQLITGTSLINASTSTTTTSVRSTTSTAATTSATKSSALKVERNPAILFLALGGVGVLSSIM